MRYFTASTAEMAGALIVLDDNAGELAAHILRLFRYLDRHLARDLLVDGRDLTIGIGDHGRLAGIRLLADGHRQRQRAEEIDAVLGAHLLTAALAEDRFRMAAVGADVRTHVLDDAENRDADLLEHLQPLARVEQRDVLR